MQFLEGETLQRHIEGKPLKTEALLELAIQMADCRRGSLEGHHPS
jgi:hypothetical protein